MAWPQALSPVAVIAKLKDKIRVLQQQWRGTWAENERLRKENEQLRQREQELEQERQRLRQENE